MVYTNQLYLGMRYKQSINPTNMKDKYRIYFREHETGKYHAIWKINENGYLQKLAGISSRLNNKIIINVWETKTKN